MALKLPLTNIVWWHFARCLTKWSFVWQIVQFDGGEANFMSGEFNQLQSVSEENWDMIEDKMRRTKWKWQNDTENVRFTVCSL